MFRRLSSGCFEERVMGRNQVLAVRRAAAFAALVASVVGLGIMGRASAMPAGAVASGPTTPGYHMVTIKKAGFSLEVPNTWLVLDSTSKSYAEVLRRVAAAYRSSCHRSSSSLPVSSVVLFAVDQSDADFASNLSVVPLPLDKWRLFGPGRRPDGAEGAAPAGLGTQGAEDEGCWRWCARRHRGLERQPA